MLAWGDGLERAPCRHEVREIPQRSVYSQSLWITRKGDHVWKRCYNKITNSWAWTDRVPLIYDEEGKRQGLHLPHLVSLELLIAMAWRSGR